MQKITDELQRKEAKWGPTISKLQDQVKFLEKENQLLHEENHKLKMKNASPKVIKDNTTAASRLRAKPAVNVSFFKTILRKCFCGEKLESRELRFSFQKLS